MIYIIHDSTCVDFPRSQTSFQPTSYFSTGGSDRPFVYCSWRIHFSCKTWICIWSILSFMLYSSLFLADSLLKTIYKSASHKIWRVHTANIFDLQSIICLKVYQHIRSLSLWYTIRSCRKTHIHITFFIFYLLINLIRKIFPYCSEEMLHIKVIDLN